MRDIAAGRAMSDASVEDQTRRVLANVAAILDAAGSSMDRVVKCTAMMADMAEWPAMNAIYATYFPNHYPARSAFGATALALGARVEIECIAALEELDAAGPRADET